MKRTQRQPPMDPFEPPGDPGDPRDPGNRGTQPEMQAQHFVDTETPNKKEIRPKMVEHRRNLFDDNIGASPNEDDDKETAPQP